MMRAIRISRLADKDLDDQSFYYAKVDPGLAFRFLKSVQSSLRRIAEVPGIGAPCAFENPLLAGIRRWPIKRFRDYLIFYRMVNDEVEVVRILHGARDIETILGGQ